MNKEKVLKNTILKLRQLDERNLKEANDFVEFLLAKVSERELTREIQQQAERSDSFSFLEDEEELYSHEDLKQDKES